MRGSGWDRPKVSFKVGDYVLVGRQTKGTMDIATHPGVMQVSEVRNGGVLELRGSDGVRITEQVKNVAHLLVPVLDPVVDTEFWSEWIPSIASSVGGGVGRPRWCCVTCATWGITFGASRHRWMLCLWVVGHASVMQLGEASKGRVWIIQWGGIVMMGVARGDSV